MNIWKWIFDIKRDLRANGNSRLADLIDEIPPHVCDGRQAMAVAALPEAVSLARSIKNPWLEVYFRHWIINGRVSRHEEGEAALKETVELFEFAHREETIGCPQSVCTTQDIAICYGHVDGPGYAVERLAVCEETMKRIDPKWDCFGCIGAERTSALIDAGRPAEALEYADRQRELMTSAGKAPGMTFEQLRARARFLLGDYDEALDLLQAVDDGNCWEDGELFRFTRACLRFRTLAAKGEFDAAWIALPPESDNVNFRENLDLVAGLSLVIAAHPEHNNHAAGRRTGAALRRYSEGGAHRDTLEALEHHVRLAVARGARWTAQTGLDLACPHLAKLRSPMGAPERFAQLEALVAAMPAVSELPVAAHLLVDDVFDSPEVDPERAVELLLLGAAQFPSNAELAGGVAEAMIACGASAHARTYMWTFVRTNPDSFVGGSSLLSKLIKDGDHEGVSELSALAQASNPALSHWCQARLAFVTERWDDVGAHVARLLELEPERRGTKWLWAAAAMRAKQFGQALELREQIAADSDQPDLNARLWHAIVAASAAQRWDRVRAIAAQLDIELEGAEGEVDQEWEIVRLRFMEDGEPYDYYARRTGPATARVLDLAGGGRVQHVDDVVVFGPDGLEPWPEEDDEGRERFVQLYDIVHVLKKGNFSDAYLVDGVRPDEDQFDALTSALNDLGWRWSRRSDPDYEVFDSETENTFSGIYFLVAAPDGIAPADMHEALVALTAGFAHPMCWPALAEAAGIDEEKHWAISERFDL